MRAVYLFYEGDGTRIPAFEENKHLHNILTAKGGGVWNANSREYFFNRKIDARKLSSLIPDIPIVLINGNKYEPTDIIGFFDRKWFDNINANDYGKTEIAEINYFSDDWKEKLETELNARKYSRSTIKSYTYYNKDLCRWLKKQPEEIKLDHIKKYLAYRGQNDNQSAATLNIALSAFKFFFNYILKRDKIREQKRPRQDKRLPVVLSKSDIKKMIFNVKNPKHQLILMIVYSSGLRIGEVVKLKKEDIDISRKSVFIHKGKGRKDRYTITSDKVITALKEYIEKYNITDWLFPGQPATRHLNARSAQNIFEKALKLSGIEKNATSHSLRHSFATHLLESGIDIVYIRDLLGHSSVRTTERYTHVARRKALTILSPLDTIDEPDFIDET